MIDCYQQCHGGINPHDTLVTPGNYGVSRIVNYADDILFRGCARSGSCHGPLDGFQTKLQAWS